MVPFLGRPCFFNSIMAITKAAKPAFISVIPLPKSLPSFSVMVNGSLSHAAKFPGSTTSMCPETARTGAPLPISATKLARWPLIGRISEWISFFWNKSFRYSATSNSWSLTDLILIKSAKIFKYSWFSESILLITPFPLLLEKITTF